MISLLGAPFALPRLLLANFRSMITNIALLGQVFSNLGRMKLRILILPLIILFFLLLPVRIFYWVLALPYDLIVFASDLRKERLARNIAAEGANIYPLF